MNDRPRVINGHVHRPRPTAEWTFDFYDHRTLNAAHHNKAKVHVSFAGGIAKEYAPIEDPYAEERAALVDDGTDLPPAPDPMLIPNCVTVEVEGGTVGPGKGPTNAIRLTRDGAAKLRDALDLALNWDGS